MSTESLFPAARPITAAEEAENVSGIILRHVLVICETVPAT